MKKIIVLLSLIFTSAIYCSDAQSVLSSKEAIRQLYVAIAALPSIIDRPGTHSSKELCSVLNTLSEAVSAVALINGEYFDEARRCLVKACNDHPSILIAGILTDERLQPSTPEQAMIIKKAQAFLEKDLSANK